MKIKIDEINKKIQIDLNPNDYFLKKCEEESDKWCGEYALVHKLDMDYCGKPPQEGMPVIYLTKQEAEKLRVLVNEIL